MAATLPAAVCEQLQLLTTCFDVTPNFPDIPHFHLLHFYDFSILIENVIHRCMV